MMIKLAKKEDIAEIAQIDTHIPHERLAECIERGHLYILKEDTVFGVLRYSLFWQTIPFLDLLYLKDVYRNRGLGTEMMRRWEKEMKLRGYSYVMTSTQADEDAWRFYEKLGYHQAGGFFPPEQEAEDIIYLKKFNCFFHYIAKHRGA